MHKVSNGSLYAQYRPKHCKPQAYSADQNCWWNCTMGVQYFGYGPQEICQNDIQKIVYTGDSSSTSSTSRQGIINVEYTSGVNFVHADNTWYCFEHRITANDAGQYNAVYERWINDVLVWRLTGFKCRPWTYAATKDRTFDRIEFESYTAYSGSLCQTWIDNIVVSDSRIYAP